MKIPVCVRTKTTNGKAFVVIESAVDLRSHEFGLRSESIPQRRFTLLHSFKRMMLGKGDAR